MARKRKVPTQELTAAASQPVITSAEVRKTTLYLPPALHDEAKRCAIDAEMSMNSFVIAAIERSIAGAQPAAAISSRPIDVPARPDSARRPEDLDLRTVVQALAARLERVEKALGTEVPAHEPAVGQWKRRLTVGEVRELVRAILIERGAPMPHRMLLEHLLYERAVRLPGEDVNENLRTILVHPKSKGFRLIKQKGYWVDDRPEPK